LYGAKLFGGQSSLLTTATRLGFGHLRFSR
jgi:hypothetical protein